MRRQKSREGYLLIDHRASPGIDAETLRNAGFTNAPDLSEGTVAELPTLTCAHCKSVQIKNHQRTRERGRCHNCDHYICDACALAMKLGGECRPFQALADAVIGSDKPPPQSLILPPLPLRS